MSPRGGKREGAGRKPLPPEKQRKPQSIWLSEEEREIARRIGGNVSKGVQEALRQAREREEE